MKVKRSRHFRRLIVAASLLLLLVAGGKLWIAPALLQDGIRNWLGQYWSQWVEVDHVEIDWRGVVHARGMRLLDEAGRQWMATEWADFTIAWNPRPSLVLSEAGGIDIQAHVDQGRLNPPLTMSPANGAGNSNLTFHKLAMKLPLPKGQIGLSGNRMTLARGGRQAGSTIEFAGSLGLGKELLSNLARNGSAASFAGDGSLWLKCALVGKDLYVLDGKFVNAAWEITILPSGHIDLQTGQSSIAVSIHPTGAAKLVQEMVGKCIPGGEYRFEGNWRDFVGGGD